MPGKGKNKKGKGKGHSEKKCPFKEESENIHNSPDWYSRETIPLIGANFTSLTGVGVDPRVLTNGMHINTCVKHGVAITPPLDLYKSAMSKMSELYTELRESNSGAANYNVKQLAAYVFNVMTLRALLHHVARQLAAVRSGSALYRESPAMFANAVGLMNYETEAAKYAEHFNNLSLLMKDVEYLPIVPLSYLDRAEFLFSTLFTDSQTTRPALIALIPTNWWIYSVDDDTGDLVATRYGQDTSTAMSNELDSCHNIYNTIVNAAKNDIIRGDLLKAFGNDAMRHNLLPTLSSPLRMGYNEDVACQLENATLVSSNYTNVTLDISAFKLQINAFTRSGAQYGLGSYMINYHGSTAPVNDDLTAITRLACVGTKSSDTVYVQYSSGITVTRTDFITAVQQNAAPTQFELGDQISQMWSSVQSTAVAAWKKVVGTISLVDRFPMVIVDPDNANGAIIDVDNYTILDKNALADITELANRSLMDAHLPRRADGRIDKGSPKS